MSNKFMPSVLRQLDLNVLYMLMINRRTFRYNLKDVASYFCHCVCLRRTKWIARSSKLKQHYYHRRGEQKLEKDLDIVRLLKRI